MQADGSNAVLTDLCAICHTNPIKYTCPRCGIHTCSLPCVKRHKAWAQCSGIRNPAAYRKRAELATPSSIDQDFNFITSVERSLQRADETAHDKGIDLAPSGVGRNGPDIKRKFDAEVEERGIRLIRAPAGLSRNKQNKSHWAGGQNKCILWTTEWLFHDGQKKINNVRETRTVAQAFLEVFGRRTLGRKRKRDVAETNGAPASQCETAATQQNLEAEDSAKVEPEDTTTTITPGLPGAMGDLGHYESADDDGTIYGDEEHPANASGSLEVNMPQSQVILTEPGNDPSRAQGHPALKESLDTKAILTDNTGCQPATVEKLSPAGGDSLTQNCYLELPSTSTGPNDNISQLLSHLHFYLLRPNTAKFKCLIPIAQTSTLKDVLRDRTLLEFPTFYVREEPPESLPEPFISEEKYTQLYGSQMDVSLPAYSAPGNDDSHPQPLTDIDEQKVLEVLQQDLTG
ncbi:hypothetical protein PV08_08351 [Exophiala spinifera]|uniref:Box C/D snoRNA protein 1 n=1 Tax=Exophiala spinifera TaxID=91928 RepID=A0A0D2BPW6_9EURO|nr:uncharacterized protein PV08_08351 [Exophiala spinifera]KIW13164.1 hypothetical protein PV08_08351 [Exophiala spinifera]